MRDVCFLMVWGLLVQSGVSSGVISPDPLGDALGSDGVAAMGGLASGPVTYSRSPHSGLSAALKSLAKLPPPLSGRSVLTDPNLLMTSEFNCNRDYETMCPVGFVNVGHVYGDEPRCSADIAKYQGPCISDAFPLENVTRATQRRFIDVCSTQWPCKACTHGYDYSLSPCPINWKTVTASIDSSSSASLTLPGAIQRHVAEAVSRESFIEKGVDGIATVQSEFEAFFGRPVVSTSFAKFKPIESASELREYLKTHPMVRCVPPDDYYGPCTIPERGITFYGLSPKALNRFSELCFAYWPCRVIKR